MNNEICEDLVACKFLFDGGYANGIAEYFDESCCHQEYNKTVVSAVKGFLKKHRYHPKKDDMALFLEDDLTRQSFRRALEKYKDLPKDLSPDLLNERTVQFLKSRRLFIALNTTIGELQNGSSSLESVEILKRFEKVHGIEINHKSGFDYFEGFESFIESLDESEEKISTGYDFLDKHLDGGFCKNGKALYCFQGGTNVGKSIVLGNFAINALLEGCKVLIITLEMSEYNYAKRITSGLTNIALRELKNERDVMREKIETIKNTVKCSLRIKEFAPKSLTVEGLDNYLDKITKKGFKPDIVFLDYINLMETSDKTLQRDERITDIAERTRGLTYGHACSIITVTQANRQGYETKPGLQNTSDSMGIPKTCDFFASLWREEEDLELGLLKLEIQKSRFGIVGPKNIFQIDKNTLRMSDYGQHFSDEHHDLQKSIKRYSK